jgi:hypothetical protein
LGEKWLEGGGRSSSCLGRVRIKPEETTKGKRRRRRGDVTPPKLASANLVESLAIYPFKLTCDQMENHPYKNVRVNARKDEQI